VRRASLLVLLTVALAACGGDSGDGSAGGGLSDLTSVEELSARFNEDRGEPRLVLLLSPT
jgi:ABC-type glycerol-3-phosphate transport system substrate-binding protein